LLSSALPFVPDNQHVAALTLFPNPAKDFVEIQFYLAEKANYRVNVFAANGQIVQSFGEKKDIQPGICHEHLDINQLPPGTYFVEVQTSGAEVFTGIFVKH
jgi:hypothetical protein